MKKHKIFFLSLENNLIEGVNYMNIIRDLSRRGVCAELMEILDFNGSLSKDE